MRCLLNYTLDSLASHEFKWQNNIIFQSQNNLVYSNQLCLPMTNGILPVVSTQFWLWIRCSQLYYASIAATRICYILYPRSWLCCACDLPTKLLDVALIKRLPPSLWLCSIDIFAWLLIVINTPDHDPYTDQIDLCNQPPIWYTWCQMPAISQR